MAEFDATKMDNAAKQADAELEQIKELHRGWGLDSGFRRYGFDIQTKFATSLRSSQ